ncbi:MAG: class I SAM-dependent methyltransferase [Bacteroidetes bacterium]|nr:class I SAM-dependent methyltransferase [Bacteroidota bacterium]
MLDKYKETFKTWNKVASLYQEKFMNLDLYNETYNYICENLKIDRAKILDVGCGPGNITKYLLSKRKDFVILGIDVASNMIELARKNNPNARFSIMDARRVNDLDARFDCIICGFILPYLSQNDFERFLNDSYRLLNHNGLIYLSYVEGDSINSGYQTGSSVDKVYFYYYSEDFVKSKLAENNFSDIKTFKVQYKRTETDIETHTIMIAIKTMA